MFSIDRILQKPNWIYIFIFGLLFIGTAIFNKGFLASDEYWVGIDRYIPAQNSSARTLVHEDDVKSPMQIMPMFLLAQLSLKLGIEEPYNQYSFVVLGVGLFAFLFYWLGIELYYLRLYLADKKGISELRPHKNLTYLIFSFYFASSLILTRPMFESVSAPFLFISVIFALLYDKFEDKQDLIIALIFFSISFILRPQSCLTSLTLLILPILKKRWKDLCYVIGAGIIALILTGLPDFFLINKFHGSILKLANYNIAHGEDYGKQPFYYFPVLIFILTLAPIFIRKYKNDFLKKNIRQLKAPLFYIFFFVLLHSFFPQKFERFLIPILPILFLLLVPLLYDLILNRNQLKFRWYSLISINFLLFFFATFFPGQKNITDLSLFVNKNKEITNLISVDNAIDWIPRAFINRKEPNIEYIKNIDLLKTLKLNCNSLIITRDNIINFNENDYLLKARFDVNPIEKLAHYLNPINNARRVPLNVWGCNNNL